MKPEIGPCDNNFKEQRNHAEMFVEEFWGVPFILAWNYYIARYDLYTWEHANGIFFFFFLPFIRLAMTQISILEQSEDPLTFPSWTWWGNVFGVVSVHPVGSVPTHIPPTNTDTCKRPDARRGIVGWLSLANAHRMKQRPGSSWTTKDV